MVVVIFSTTTQLLYMGAIKARITINITELLKIFSLCLTPPYMGHTGYSTTENVNNIKIVHLHWGLQLIFDESQKEGNNEIWIDVYPLTRFLAKHTQVAVKVEGTKEWRRNSYIVDPAVEEYVAQAPGDVKIPTNEILQERDERLEKQPEILKSSES